MSASFEILLPSVTVCDLRYPQLTCAYYQLHISRCLSFWNLVWENISVASARSPLSCRTEAIKVDILQWEVSACLRSCARRGTLADSVSIRQSLGQWTVPKISEEHEWPRGLMHEPLDWQLSFPSVLWII